MEQQILALKRAILELERYNSTHNESRVIESADNIISICQGIKENLKDQRQAENKSIKYIKLNTIPFIYKPLRVKNYFEGDYIIKFAESRSTDLKEARALDVHNKFWTQYKAVKGNIFGSVPKELLKEESIKVFLAKGWREAEVDILDVKDSFEDAKEIIGFCENTFKHYILVIEESTNTYLILHYKID